MMTSDEILENLTTGDSISSVKPKARSTSIESQYLEKRNALWPIAGEEDLLVWNRTSQKGYTTVPRTLPLLLQMMDSVAEKNKPVSGVYFAIWCRTFNTNYLEINSPEELIFESGFTATRRLSIWRARMRQLVDLGFIKVSKAGNEEFKRVLLINPFLAIFLHFKTGGIEVDDYNNLKIRCIELGSKDCSTFENLPDEELLKLRNAVFS